MVMTGREASKLSLNVAVHLASRLTVLKDWTFAPSRFSRNERREPPPEISGGGTGGKKSGCFSRGDLLQHGSEGLR